MTQPNLSRASSIARFATYGILALSILETLSWSAQQFDLKLNYYLESKSWQNFIMSANFGALILYIFNARWIFVVSKNYQPRQVGSLVIKPKWAAWSNIVPFANLYVPFVQLRRVYFGATGQAKYTPAWIWLWWWSWLVQFIFASIIMLALSSGNLGTIAGDDIILGVLPLWFKIGTLISSLSQVIGGMLFLRLIHELEKLQNHHSSVFS